MKCRCATLITAAIFTLFYTAWLYAGQWPVYAGDNYRSFIKAETPDLPWQLQWHYIAADEPRPAWPEPAKQDFWHNIRRLTPALTYDRAWQIVVADGRAFFGSSADDRVYCLDIQNGKLLWQFFTAGPVRLAPVIYQRKVYFGSDDGFVYCLNWQGQLLWKRQIVPQDYYMPGNERIISLWPLRSGVLIQNDILYCTAGVFPSYGVYLAALNCDNGQEIWRHKIEIAPNGYLLAGAGKLFVPSGRIEPGVFQLSNGKYLGRVNSPGGAFALIADNNIITGPGRREGAIGYSDTDSRAGMASFNGLRMLIDDGIAYLLGHNSLAAFDRFRYVSQYQEQARLNKEKSELEKQIKRENTPARQEQLAQINAGIRECRDIMAQCYLWTIETNHPYSLAKAGDVIFAGGNDIITAFDSKSGAELWHYSLQGKAYGITIADKKLLVSTSKGHIYCFAADICEKPLVIDNRKSATKVESPGLLASLARQSGIYKGYCLIIDGTAELALYLAQNTALQIISLQTDDKSLDIIRQQIDEHNLATRITVMHWTKAQLPFAKYIFNLVLAADLPDLDMAEIQRVLRPYGGMAILQDDVEMIVQELKADQLSRNNQSREEFTIEINAQGYARIVRGSLAGAGQWNSLYADLGNSANSQDNIKGPLTIQWFGRPGPREMIDRHHRPMSSLCSQGRLFIPGNDKVFCADAYNGMLLWELDLPGSRRIGVMRNSGQMLLDKQSLYITSGENCFDYAVKDAALQNSYVVPADESGQHHWGYLGVNADSVIGSATVPDASFSDLDYRDSPLSGTTILEGDFKEAIISQFLFAVDKKTSQLLWTYKAGAIINSAIAIANDTIYFVESLNTQLDTDLRGRVRIDHFCQQGVLLVALDANSGQKRWSKKLQLPHQQIIYLSCVGDMLLLTGCYNSDKSVYYVMDTFDAADGAEKWQQSFLALDIQGKKPTSTGGSHGEQWQHPVIIGNTIYLRPYAFDLATGEKKDYIAYRGGHGCGGWSGSVNYLYGRGDVARRYPLDVNSTEGIPLTSSARPGCFINIIPASGLILMPESSSGCTCGYALQTSIAFAPADLLAKDEE